MNKYEERQRQAALNYKANGGNLKQAMIDAGYSESYANKNARYLWGIIGQEVKESQKEIKSNKIKTITEIQEFWSGNMENAELEMSHRIKSSELLAKSQGAFVENVNVNGNINNPLANLTTEELKKLANGK